MRACPKIRGHEGRLRVRRAASRSSSRATGTEADRVSPAAYAGSCAPPSGPWSLCRTTRDWGRCYAAGVSELLRADISPLASHASACSHSLPPTPSSHACYSHALQGHRCSRLLRCPGQCGSPSPCCLQQRAYSEQRSCEFGVPTAAPALCSLVSLSAVFGSTFWTTSKRICTSFSVGAGLRAHGL